jgi:septal ring factor EnvC (AmiA/AmiB activator)
MISLKEHCLNWFYVLSLLLILLLLFAGRGYSQDQKTRLEKDKQKIEEEIKYNAKLLDETKKSQETTLNQLVIISKQISTREKLIVNINNEIKAVNEEINQNNQTLAELNEELAKLKEEYASMIYYAYKNRSAYDKLMFIFSSADFNQAYKRLKYFQQYSAYRKDQVKLIDQTKEEIKKKLEDLENLKLAKVELLRLIESERNKLNTEKNQQGNVITDLNKKEKQLLATIKEKEKAAKKLQKEIEKIIAEEINAASKKTGTTKSGSFDLTPSEVKLSADFKMNKGILPWPLEKGIISGTFGEHPHPVLKNVITKNNGIDILTDKDARALAIFDGEVTRVMSIPNYNYVIMIRHGEFLSVYSNLSEVFVQKGDKVTTRQEIGNINTDAKDNKTELHFELWQGKTLLNPALWLAGEN